MEENKQLGGLIGPEESTRILGALKRGANRRDVLAPSMLGKAKANIQFGAITLAIWRPDLVIAGRFLDEWAMLVAAVITVWSAVDYLGQFVGRLTRRDA